MTAKGTRLVGLDVHARRTRAAILASGQRRAGGQLALPAAGYVFLGAGAPLVLTALDRVARATTGPRRGKAVVNRAP